MNSKAAIAAAITLGFFAGMIAENVRMTAEIRNTPPVVTHTTDTLWQQSDPVYMPGVPGVIDTLRDTLYAFEPNPDVVARMDTVLPPRGDVLGVTYHFPPVNTFDLRWTPSPFVSTHETTTNTVTVVERRFFLGPYFRADARSPWFDGIMTLSKMEFSLAGGFAIQYDKFQMDLEPMNLLILDSKASVGFGISVRYYPWAN